MMSKEPRINFSEWKFCPYGERCPNYQKFKIDRVWAMPNHKTFEIQPVKELLEQEEKDLPGIIVDPFPHPFKQDAIEYLKSIQTESIYKVRFDPPYSQRQLREMYDNLGLSLEMNNGYWAKCRAEIARILKVGGKCISFGWNSNGIGLQYGFEITRIRLIAHGSQHNDTICVVEVKRQARLDSN